MINMSYIFLAFTFVSGISHVQAQSNLREWIQIGDRQRMKELSKDVWLHEWKMEVEGFGTVSSNGLLIVNGKEALLVDTPKDDAMTAVVLAWAKGILGVEVKKAIITHFHNDRMGGIAALHDADVQTIAHTQTARLGSEKGYPKPSVTFQQEKKIILNGRSVMAFYPGAGHSRDNIVVWLEDEGLLYGGCFIKSGESKNLGNLEDAFVNDWPASLLKTVGEFPETKIVIPGHGSPGGIELLDHNLHLLEQHRSASN